jgi:hypothetical protein
LFEIENTCFKCGDFVGGFLAENVRPISDDAQRSGRNQITGDGERRRQNPANLFGVQSGRRWDAWLITGFTECDVSSRTGDSRERFSKARRLRQVDQLSEFRRPSATPKEKRPPSVPSDWRRSGDFHFTRARNLADSAPQRQAPKEKSMESVRVIRADQPRRRPAACHSRNLKNRITCAYTPAERAAIEFLNRTPERDDIPPKFRALRGKPRRVIAKELNADGLSALVTFHHSANRRD